MVRIRENWQEQLISHDVAAVSLRTLPMFGYIVNALLGTKEPAP